MPSTSDKQRRAMQAAASGNSTIGIPQKVGKEFAMADALRKHKPYGNSMYDYGNDTKGGIHVTHWKPGNQYGGSNSGGASIGGGSAASS